MKPIYLHLENFQCHKNSEIELSNVTSALIIGQVNGNDLHSNGVGKSTIFKAIEFCLFNECSKGLKLEKLINDEANKCKVIFDFAINNKIYRISRARTKKGATDLSLFIRSSYEEDGVNPHCKSLTEDISKKFWDDISCRRTPDTEEVLEKILKINYRAFYNGYYFAQDDHHTGLATSTKTERKEILKGTLQLVIYNALHKFVTAKANILQKDLEKKNAVFHSVQDFSKEIIDKETKLAELVEGIAFQNTKIALQSERTKIQSDTVSQLKNKSKTLIEQVDHVLKRKKEHLNKISKIEIGISDFSVKRKSVISAAKEINAEIASLKETILNIIVLDSTILQGKKVELEAIKSLFAEKSALINSSKTEIQELRIPLPDGGVCKHCRQPLTEAHRRECEKSDLNNIKLKEDYIKFLSAEMQNLSLMIKKNNDEILQDEKNIKELESLKIKLSVKEKEIVDKRALYSEYELLLGSQKIELLNLNEELEKIKNEENESSAKEVQELQLLIEIEEKKLFAENGSLSDLNKLLSNFNSEKAVCEHAILEKKKSNKQKADLKNEIILLDEEYSGFPNVIEAFGPTGIPNLIIQNVLDDFQLEANKILEQIRPGLQLSFLIEKTKGDGQQDDDLDIEYFLNGKSRDYMQLSGAQKLCVMFSLKLGVAYLLRNNIGATFDMLLLDEIDPALDKASVDAFADIIKFFQKDFTILVITHNDRLKDKFSHVIIVEQDHDMISTAKLITS